jgi:cytochrome P450
MDWTCPSRNLLDPDFYADPESAAASLEWAAATMAIIAARRAEPRNDLISVWCHASTDGVPWDEGPVLELRVMLE